VSYSVNFYGHKDLSTPDEVEAFEREVIDKVTAFATTLPGLGGGTINTTTQAQVVLQASDGTEPTNPDGSPVAHADDPATVEASDTPHETEDEFRANVEKSLSGLTDTVETLAGIVAQIAAKDGANPPA
jgi:hypothetical protein